MPYRAKSLELFFRLPGDDEDRSIEFIADRITNLSDGFKSRVNGKIDAYYEKGSWDFSRNTLRIKNLASLLKPSGYLMVSPYDIEDFHTYYTETLSNFGMVDLTKHNKEIDNLRNSESLPVKHYGWDMEIWHNTDQAMIQSDDIGVSFKAFKFSSFYEGNKDPGSGFEDYYYQPMQHISVARMQSLGNILSGGNAPTFVEFGAGSGFGSYLLARENSGSTAIGIDIDAEYIEKQALLNDLQPLPGLPGAYLSLDPKLRLILIAADIRNAKLVLGKLGEILNRGELGTKWQMWNGFNPLKVDVLWEAYEPLRKNWLPDEQRLSPKVILHIRNADTGSTEAYSDSDQYKSSFYWKAPSYHQHLTSFFQVMLRRGLSWPHNIIEKLTASGTLDVEYPFIPIYTHQVFTRLPRGVLNHIDLNVALMSWKSLAEPVYEGFPKDEAMAIPKGGIDLTHAGKAIMIQNNSDAIKFHIDPVELEGFKNSPGIVPVIIGYQPLNNLKLFLLNSV